MAKTDIMDRLFRGLIVSCQALEDEPLYGAEIMARLALAAKMGGAAGIRANSGRDIRAIKGMVDLPVIGLVKRHHEGSPVYITPTMKEVAEVYEAGADIVAIDATSALRPDGRTVVEFIRDIRARFETIILADVSVYEEAVAAQRAGTDIVATTLSGYTAHSPDGEEPDFGLVERLARDLSVPVFAEGRIATPAQAVEALRLGAFAVVVGKAITSPQTITKRFVAAIDKAAVPIRRRQLPD